MNRTSFFGRMMAIAWIATAAACSGGAPTPSASPAATPTLDTPAGSAIVATLPAPYWTATSWSPDGGYLLTANQTVSTVYDRRGRKVSEFNGQVGWLDKSHVIGPDGIPRAVSESQGQGYVANAWVVANGHGTAMIVVGVPGCVGDPMIAWYRNGSFDRAHLETFTPFGYSPDGDLALEGHMTCGTTDAELHGWKGDVDVVDLATGKTKMTLHNVRGEIAFSPGGKLLAAQSDTDVEIADIASGAVSVAKNVRLLAWIAPHRLALSAGETLEVADLTERLQVTTPEPSEVLVPSPIDGVAFGIGISWKVDGVTGSRTPVAGLAGLDLAIDANPQPAGDGRTGTWLQPSYWSPDGRVLALPTADRTQVVLISVDPNQAAPASPSN